MKGKEGKEEGRKGEGRHGTGRENGGVPVNIQL